MDDIRDLSIEINLKSVDYLVNVEIVASSKFALEIQSIQTAEVWRGCFEANYIEDLTRKTGNFKSFPIFINMLYAALKQDSATVALDILTYNDLELLRGKKTQTADTSTNSSSSRALANNKRYLILTYNVEFDRITYPLHLNYQGVADVAELTRTIRKLKEKLKAYESRGADEYWNKEMARVEKDKAQLVKEKEALAVEILKIKCENQKRLNSLSKDSSNTSATTTTTQQEIKVLKQMMKSIEESSVKEKNFYQRQMVKRDEELAALRYEIGQLRATEKALSSQLKFSEERVRNRSRNNSSISESIRQRTAPSSQPRRSESPFFNYEYMNSKKQKEGVAVAARPLTGSKSRWRSSSLDRENASIGRAGSRGRGVSPASSVNSISSIGSQRKRFNPTDYVRLKKEKAREVEVKKKNEIRYRLSGDGGSRQSLRTRSRSAGSNYSYDGGEREASYASVGGDRSSRPGRNGMTATTVGLFNRDEEMKDIDEKLKSLQMLIKNTI